MTVAQATIDRLLSRDPISNGEHLSEGLYQIVESPLKVFYGLDSATRRVEVARVWHQP